jgi:DNA-directed RNA polymerase subunit omega
MPMTNPPIGELLEKMDCRYTLVVEVSKRARQLVGGAQPLIDTKETKAVSVAVDEVNRGLIVYDRPSNTEEE